MRLKYTAGRVGALRHIALSAFVAAASLLSMAMPAQAQNGVCYIHGPHDECFNTRNSVIDNAGNYTATANDVSTAQVTYLKVVWVYHYENGQWTQASPAIYCYYATECRVSATRHDTWWGDWLNYGESFNPDGSLVASDLSYPLH